MLDDQIRCPKCDSTNVNAHRKGYGCLAGLLGAFILGAVGFCAAGPIGLIALGTIGALLGAVDSRKVDVTCLRCGHAYTPDEYAPPPGERETTGQNVASLVAKAMLGLGLAAAIVWWAIAQDRPVENRPTTTRPSPTTQQQATTD
jgi:hypothetical protein